MPRAPTAPGRGASSIAAIALVQLDRVEEHARIRARQFALYDRPDDRRVLLPVLVREPVAHSGDAAPWNRRIDARQVEAFGLRILG